MSRLIKFRIFDKLNKRFLRSSSEHFTPVVDIGAWQDEERWAISQFIGLKDKNGNDIWEDDILRWSHPTDDIGIVEYVRNDIFATYPACAFYALNVKARGICPFQMDDDYEIIGNCWENSDLIT